MQNPILSEYQRTRRLGAFFCVAIKFCCGNSAFLADTGAANGVAESAPGH